jgi:hypothetical protein
LQTLCSAEISAKRQFCTFYANAHTVIKAKPNYDS